MGPGSSHLAVYDLTMLVDASEEVNERLRAQARYKTVMYTALM